MPIKNTKKHDGKISCSLRYSNAAITMQSISDLLRRPSDPVLRSALDCLSVALPAAVHFHSLRGTNQSARRFGSFAFVEHWNWLENNEKMPKRCVHRSSIKIGFEAACPGETNFKFHASEAEYPSHVHWIGSPHSWMPVV